MRTLLILACVALTSCAASKPTPIAYECPKLQLPADPVVPVSKLTSQSKPDEVIKAWVATAVAYKAWNHAVRIQVHNSL